MGSTAMLSLDLERGVSEERRQRFYEHLRREKWVKVAKVTTTWWARFNEGVSDAVAVQVTRQDVANAASYAGINYYEAVVHVGDGEPVAF